MACNHRPGDGTCPHCASRHNRGRPINDLVQTTHCLGLGSGKQGIRADLGVARILTLLRCPSRVLA